MKSNYKKLGPFIRVVNERNTDLEDETLLGVSVKKVFIPSIANTVGTNFKKYKIVRKNQFTYIPDTSRRGDKIGLALLESHDSALVSQAYTVFEVIDHNLLSPEYLMMWFRRPEFNRYARYKSHGSVREIFDWGEMCDVALPIPSIEKQQQIVDEYNTITKRIVLNEQLNKKLEDTAQTLYKHWFVDFEFPNEQGEPYKSSGGAMVYNEELDKEIPEGWKVEEVGNVIENIGGGTPKTEEKSYWEDGDINWFSPTDITNNKFIFCNDSNKKITKLGLQKSSAKIFPAYSIMLTSRATVGKIGINASEASTNQGFIILIPNVSYPIYMLIEWLKSNLDEIDQLSSGSTFKEISKSDFRGLRIFSTDMSVELEQRLNPIYEKIKAIALQSKILEDLKTLLLSKMTKVEEKIFS